MRPQIWQHSRTGARSAGLIGSKTSPDLARISTVLASNGPHSDDDEEMIKMEP
jgi:hypothetical protein